MFKQCRGFLVKRIRNNTVCVRVVHTATVKVLCEPAGQDAVCAGWLHKSDDTTFFPTSEELWNTQGFVDAAVLALPLILCFSPEEHQSEISKVLIRNNIDRLCILRAVGFVGNCS